jgi:ribosomal protein L12E/L44/L45/RPP1/RPP2
MVVVVVEDDAISEAINHVSNAVVAAAAAPAHDDDDDDVDVDVIGSGAERGRRKGE